MSDRSRDWLTQARRDLDQAKDSRRAARHEWACFAAQQAAEKAVKALHLHCGQEAWGRVAAKLLQELPAGVSATSELVDKAPVPADVLIFTEEEWAECARKGRFGETLVRETVWVHDQRG